MSKSENNENNNDKILTNAQYRKSLSIAFFNATNSAISLVAPRQIVDKDELLKEVVRFRDFFLEEHKNYYAEVIAKVGVEYNVEEAVKKLKAVKNKEELHIVWLNFSEDERRDEEIAKIAQIIKKKYEKIQ